MRRVAFHADACADFTHWAKEDPKHLERLTRLISDKKGRVNAHSNPRSIKPSSSKPR
jgi:hypothetical protein